MVGGRAEGAGRQSENGWLCELNSRREAHLSLGKDPATRSPPACLIFPNSPNKGNNKTRCSQTQHNSAAFRLGETQSAAPVNARPPLQTCATPAPPIEPAIKSDEGEG